MLIESTDLGPVIDDVLTDLRNGKYPHVLGLLCEAHLAGLDPFRLLHILTGDDRDGLYSARALVHLRYT